MENHHYLRTKRDKLGHLLEELDGGGLEGRVGGEAAVRLPREEQTR
jgi:hypothetical protein